jgi:hypothetical protein
MEDAIKDAESLPLSPIFVLIQEVQESTFLDYESRHPHVGGVTYAAQSGRDKVTLKNWMASQYASILARPSPQILKRIPPRCLL